MTHEGELVNLAHYRLVRIEASGGEAAAPTNGRASRNGKGAATAASSLPLLVSITATGGKEAGTVRLTGDLPREDAELIMLKIADGLRAIGYVEDHDEDEPQPTRRRASAAHPVPAVPPPVDEEPAAPPKPRRGRKPKAAAAVAAVGAGGVA